jgi:hypothetical protein
MARSFRTATGRANAFYFGYGFRAFRHFFWGSFYWDCLVLAARTESRTINEVRADGANKNLEPALVEIQPLSAAPHARRDAIARMVFPDKPDRAFLLAGTEGQLSVFLVALP